MLNQDYKTKKKTDQKCQQSSNFKLKQILELKYFHRQLYFFNAKELIVSKSGKKHTILLEYTYTLRSDRKH